MKTVKYTGKKLTVNLFWFSLISVTCYWQKSGSGLHGLLAGHSAAALVLINGWAIQIAGNKTHDARGHFIFLQFIAE